MNVHELTELLQQYPGHIPIEFVELTRSGTADIPTTAWVFDSVSEDNDDPGLLLIGVPIVEVEEELLDYLEDPDNS